VTSFQVDDRVFGFKGLPFGAHAQYLVIPEDGFLATMPARLSFEEAAPSTEGSHYALALIRKAKVHGGQDVLVNGATGAIGSAAVQLLRQLGAKVTATCGPEHLQLVKGLGADRVIDHTAQDFTRDTQRYDVVLDAVGKSSFLRCRRLLKSRGLYLSSEFGPLAQNLLLALVAPLLGGRKVLLNIARDDPQLASYLLVTPRVVDRHSAANEARRSTIRAASAASRTFNARLSVPTSRDDVVRKQRIPMGLSGRLALSAQHAVDRLDPVGGFAGACVLADGGQDGGDRLAARLVGDQLPCPVVLHALPQLGADSGADSGNVHARPVDLRGHPGAQATPAVQVGRQLAQHRQVTHHSPTPGSGYDMGPPTTPMCRGGSATSAGCLSAGP